MRIASGELDRRISIWRAPLIDDGTAKTLGEPARIADRWARRSDVSDGERVRAAELGQEVSTRWLVRSDAVTRTITGKDEIWHKGLKFEVTGTKVSTERDDAIELTAVARPDQAAG